jgi:hypothetical protein
MGLGYIADLSFINMTGRNGSTGILRADANLAFAMNDVFSVKGGINTAKFVTGESAQKWSPGLGFQAGVGVQLGANMSFSMGYTRISQSAQDDLTLSGPELGLTGTF